MYVKTLGASDDVYAGDEGAPDLVDLVNGGAGNDDLSGGQGDDTLNGQDDNDLLNGGAGDDILDGGAGDDTAVFSGAAGDYIWSGDSHTATITGPDGTDTLIDVEHLKFGSTIINLPTPNASPSAPSDGDTAANTVSEGAANGTVVAGLALGATDPDAGQTLTWSLLDDAGGRFAIDAATGVVTVLDGSKLNFETAASHQVTVQVTDGTATSSASFTIQVANVAPSAPADSDAGANTVTEGAANGTVVAGLALGATDPNGGVTYSLTDDAGGRFAIDATTGVVTVLDASKLNFETAASHQITVQASDGTATSLASFTIQVANVAAGAPTDADAAANTISEAAANGTAVSGLAIAAADPNGGVTYSLVDDAGGRFAINATTGVVTLADASLIDFDVATSHQITVRATDGQGATDTTFTIDVANAPPSVPTDADTTANLVSEDAVNGALVGVTASAAEPKTGAVSYSLSDDAGGRFAIDATTGVVTVADASKLNFEVAPTHQITVRATDGQGVFSSQTFTIAVANVANGAPQDGDTAANTISEGAVNGDAVQGLSISAPDINGGPLVYSLLDDAGGRFAINAATGVVTVANANLLNFEAATSHQILVRAASGAESATATFTIGVLNAAPVTPFDANSAANSVVEAPNNGAATGLTVSAPDPHGGTVTYSLTNNAGGRFAINATTGVVTVLNGALLDHDIQSSHTITVQASDGVLTSTNDFVITLVDKIDSYWTGTTAANTYAVTATDVQDWQLDGLAGNDTLTGGAGDDVIIGGAGDDILAGGGGNDTFYVAAGEGIDTFDGGAGYDTIKASSDNVTITIKSMTGIEAFGLNNFVNVNIAGTSAADTLDFTGVTIPWTPTISLGAGNDVVYGTAGADNIKGEAGLDDLRGGAGNDILDGGADADSLAGGDGNDTLIGGAGNDSMSGGNGDDLFLMGVSSGTDWVEGDAGYDTVQATADNTIFSFSMLRGVEVISSGGFANVSVAGTSAADQLDFGGFTFIGTVIISGGAGNDAIYGSLGSDVIRGDAGDDWVRAYSGDDVLDGGDGNDGLNGEDGNDTLIGGAGNDAMSGGNGDDVFLVGLNSGLDTFDGGAGNDTVRATAANTVIGLAGVPVAGGIETFSNGGFANVTIAGSSGADGLDFTNVISTGGMAINGLAGDDVIYGSNNAANLDIINGGAGNDAIYGQAGDDLLDGGAGNDTLVGGVGDDVFLVGLSAGNDIYDGGAGADTVRASVDNAVIGIGNFRAVAAIESFSSGGFANVTIAGSTGVDELDFTTVVSTGGLAVNLLAGDDVMTGSNTASNIDIINGGAGNDTIYGMAGNDVLDGGDGVDTLNGGDGVDTLTGGTGNDNLVGGAGDDVFLVGLSAGSDAYDGGAGFDEIRATANNVAISFTSLSGIESISANGFTGVTIAGSTGADNLNFSGMQINGLAINAGNSDDVVTGTNGVDIINGGTGNDTIYGLDGADVIDGGAGGDALFGGGGDDTFLVSADPIYADNFDGGAGVDTVQASANNVVIGLTGMNSIEVFSSGGFSNVTVGGTTGHDTLDFTGKTFVGSIVLNGLAGNDTITGSEGADVIKGDAGTDTLNGGAGNDILDGGADVDVLNGGAGDDVMLMSSGTGYDTYNGGDGFDEIRSNGATLIAWSSISGVEKISGGGFANVQIGPQFPGLVWNFDFSSYQLEGIAQINGGSNHDVITGSNGNDVLFGAGGADILTGGLGDDTFAYFGSADGAGWGDTVDGGAGWDKLLAQTANAQMTVSSMTSIEEISTGGFAGVSLIAYNTNDTIDLRNVVITGDLTLINLRGGDDVFYGTAGADVVDGGGGADILEMGDGDDIVRVTVGNGVDVIRGGAGYDKIVLASPGGAVDLFYGFEGIEEVQGATIGVLDIVGTTGADVIDMRGIVLKNIHQIDGDAGADVIHGSAGADTIFGGAGNDELFGEDGDDIFVFGYETGADVAHGGAGYDTLASVAVITVSGFDGIEAIKWTGTDSSSFGVKVLGDDTANTFDLTNVATTRVYYFSLLGGDDTFIGSAAGEYIFSGVGADTLTGGGGADKFAYWQGQEAAGDTIVDFTIGEDKIDVSLIDAVPVGASGGDDPFKFIGTGNFTNVQGQLRYTVVSDGVIVSGDTSGDGVADFNIKVLGVSSLAASDFVL